MIRIAYLLHRFPRTVDTFIMREIASLLKDGIEIDVISVWRPAADQTSDQLLRAWNSRVRFLLPASPFTVLQVIARHFVRSPLRFLSTLWFAILSSKPDAKGLVYQLCYLAEAILAAESITEKKYDHIHNHFGDQSGMVTMLASRFTGVGYSISFHGPHVFLDTATHTLKTKIEHAAFVRSISFFCRSQLMLFAGTTSIKSPIVHCGIDPTKYRFRKPRAKAEVLFCAARLAPEKGLEFLIQAFSTALRSHPNLTLRLAGNGPSMKALKQLAIDLNVSERVAFLGLLSEDEVARELSEADLFVLPSLAEGLPVSLMEAMASGVPVIATNIAGVGELVENLSTGFLVPPTDISSLEHAILTVIDSKELRERIAIEARKKIENEFDIDSETAKLAGAFKTLHYDLISSNGRDSLRAKPSK